MIFLPIQVDISNFYSVPSIDNLAIGNLKGSFLPNLSTMITQLTSSVSITDSYISLFAISNTILDITNHTFFSLVIYLNTISNKKSKLVPIHFNFGRVTSFFCGSDFLSTSVLLKYLFFQLPPYRFSSQISVDLPAFQSKTFFYFVHKSVSGFVIFFRCT